MRLFLTGGTGFFGKSLIKYWTNELNSNCGFDEVVILTRDPELFVENEPWVTSLKWLKLVKGDVCNLNSYPRGERFTHVIHAATESTNGPLLDSIDCFDQIIDGTRNALDFSRMVDAEKFLLTSSGGVYGNADNNTPFSEDFIGGPDPLVSANAYSVAKKTSEHLTSLYCSQYGLNTVVARCFAFVGEDLPLNAHFAIGNFIKDALFEDSIIVKGNGEGVRSYLYQYDLARWLVTILSKGTPNRAYNVGSDNPISIKDLSYLVRDIISPKKEVIFQRTISSARNWYVPNVNRAKDELGLTVRYNLRDSIERVVKEITK